MVKTILLADDEPNVLDLMKLILEDRYTIYTAKNGDEVLAALRSTTPDLIILDVMMPKVNGYEVCERLKKDPATKDIKIAMLSAKAQERDIIHARRLGADFYITKPFDPATFEKMIAEMLAR